MNDERITLLTVIGEERDRSGFVTGELVEETEIFAGKKSVSRTEFYEAIRSGRKASVIFTVDPDDLKLAWRDIQVNGSAKRVRATKVTHEGIQYRIIREYQKSPYSIELTCEEVE